MSVGLNVTVALCSFFEKISSSFCNLPVGVKWAPLCTLPWVSRYRLLFFKSKLVHNITLTCVSVLLLLSPSLSIANFLDDGMASLTSNQQPNGSWDSTEVRRSHVTAEALRALQTLSASTTARTAAANYLESAPVEDADDRARRIEVLVTEGRTVVTTVSALLADADPLGGWGLTPEFTADPLDTALALLALAGTSSASATQVSTALSFLLAQRNPDGGWGCVQGGPSDVSCTAQALLALIPYKSRSSVGPAITAAQAFLKGALNPDGSIGGEAADPIYTTALAVLALVAAGDDLGAQRSAVLSFLQESQEADGSWGGDPFFTAVALRALHALGAGQSAPVCGDGIVNSPTEACDGADLAGKTCESLGRGSGTLRCGATCIFDTSGCTTPGSPPTANFTASPSVGIVGQAVQFTDSSTDPDDAVVAWAWEFGDGATSNTRNPTHTYTTAGTYTVTLTVTDAGGHSDAFSLALTVNPFGPLPGANFTFSPATPTEADFIVFTDTTSGTVTSRTWNWGDGSPTATANPAGHRYADSGAYTVTLTVTNNQGTKQVQKPVTVANVPPTVSLVPELPEWVSGQALNFSATIRDAGFLDTITCQWEFGDGSPISTYCQRDSNGNLGLAHTYTLPTGSAAQPFPATLTVTDDEGSMGSASVGITIFPQMFDLLASSIPNLTAIGWSPLVKKLVVTRDYPCGNRLVLVGLDGTVSPPLTPNIAKQCDETKIAVAPGLGSFSLGDVFMGNGNPGEIVRVQMDANGTVTRLDNPWVTVPSTGRLRGGITFDKTGSFNFDMLTVWTDGKIFRVKSDGTFSLVAHLTQVTNLLRQPEGADVAAATGFGPASGCLLTGDQGGLNLWAVCPNGSTFIVLHLPSSLGLEVEWPLFVPSAGDLFFVDFDRGRVYKGDSRYFTNDLVGHVLLATEYRGQIWDVFYNATTNTYQTKLFTLAVKDGLAIHLEQTAFVPALSSINSTLTPLTATNPVGASHTVTATISDSFGHPVSDLALTFTVTGANPTSGTAVTNSEGVATLTYTGHAPGEDTITASSLNATTNAATTIWNQQPANAAPVLEPIEDQTLDEGKVIQVAVFASDADGDSLTLSAAGLPTFAAFTDHGDGTGALLLAPNHTDAGVHPDVEITAFDGALTDSQKFTITVLDSDRLPVADAGPDQTVNEKTAVLLNGSQSRDPDGDALTYSWTQLAAGPRVTLNLTNPAFPTFVAPDVPRGGLTLTFRLVVSTGTLNSEPDTVDVTIKDLNHAPVADAGIDQRAQEGSPVTLDGALGSFDPDSDPLTFSWEQTAGPPVTLSDPTASTPLFTTPSVGPAGETLTFKLTVSDGAAMATDVVIVTVLNINQAPAADAGEDQTKNEGSVVILNGTASNDPDGDTLTYRWTQSAGLSVTLSDVTSATPTFTAPSVGRGGTTLEFQLVVNDGALNSESKTVKITVLDLNDPPTCTLGQATPTLLWPPNHKFATVKIEGVADPNDDQGDDHGHRGKAG